jgi:hypothetical protein
MYSEFKDDQHRQQAEEFLLALGRFTVQFERVCEVMRKAIMFALRSQGLKNSGMEQVVIGDTSSAELQVLLGAVFNHLPNQDDLDRAAVKALLKDVKELTEQRNVAIHSAWQFGGSSSEIELYAVAIRQRTKQNSGAVPEIHGISASYLDELGGKLKTAQLRLQRLVICISQPEFKVAIKLNEPL